MKQTLLLKTALATAILAVGMQAAVAEDDTAAPAPATYDALRISYGESAADFLLKEKPVVTFSKEGISAALIDSETKDTLNLEFSNVKQWTIVKVEKSVIPSEKTDSADVDIPTGLNSVQTSSETVSISGGVLTVSGLNASQSVSICTVDGKVVSQAVANSQGSASVALPSDQGSVLVVRTPSQSFKIRK